MLDLNHLANERALALNELPATWRAAVWSQEFQKLSQNMSDGEVENLVALCPSVAHLKALVHYLLEQSVTTGTAPYTLMMNEAKNAGTSPAEWVAKFAAVEI
jgi:hypothetical protein